MDTRSETDFHIWGWRNVLAMTIYFEYPNYFWECLQYPLWLPLRYWLIDKYQKIYASVLTNLNLKLKYLKISASVLT